LFLVENKKKIIKWILFLEDAYIVTLRHNMYVYAWWPNLKFFFFFFFSKKKKIWHPSGTNNFFFVPNQVMCNSNPKTGICVICELSLDYKWNFRVFQLKVLKQSETTSIIILFFFSLFFEWSCLYFILLFYYFILEHLIYYSCTFQN
jgi:hypothetical protein